MVIYILRWWYTAGWMQTVQRIGEWTGSVARNFSILILATTLFSPWRRIVSVGGKSLDDRLRAAMDNFVSRCVGLVIRLFVIIAGCISLVCAFVMACLLVVVWPLVPLGVLYAIARGVTG